RANVYPTREFLTCGLGEGALNGHRHCPVEWESCSRIIGYCPVVQDVQIKRHNSLCGLFAKEAKRLGWEIFMEPHLRDNNKELFKTDLVIVNGICAKVADVIVLYEAGLTTLSDAVTEKAEKYRHLEEQVQALTPAMDIEFLGFPTGAWGWKWYIGNERLLTDLGLSSSHSKRIARAF
ncbi:PO22 protein, partial [Nothocercus nigrocapillus]|nr:PO22 protein [Nothocercus nigrocapillus]